MIRYHPAYRKEWRGNRKNITVLEINDWDDSVPSCLGGKKEGRENGKRRALCCKKTTDQTSHTPRYPNADTPTQVRYHATRLDSRVRGRPGGPRDYQGDLQDALHVRRGQRAGAVQWLAAEQDLLCVVRVCSVSEATWRHLGATLVYHRSHLGGLYLAEPHAVDVSQVRRASRGSARRGARCCHIRAGPCTG